MDNLRIVFSIAFNYLKKWLTNPRIYLIFIMLSFYLHARISPINAFCVNSGYKITPYLFAFLMSEEYTVLLVMLGVVLLFCDAPFIEIEQPYIITRSGRKLWVFGQITYIVVSSIIYFTAILFISTLLMLPNLEFSTEWGKVIGTFTQTSIAYQHNISIPFDFLIYQSYTPIASLLQTFMNCCLVSTLIGLTMFVLNLNISRSTGSIIATIFVLWKMVVSKTWTGFTRFSPVTWVSLSHIDTKGNTLYPNQIYIYLVTLTLILLLIILSVLAMRKRDIDILKSV